MILLQAAANSAITWRTYLQDVNQAAQIIGTILIIIYVVYTYRTFIQIKKQTDYQQDAYLKVETTLVKDINASQNAGAFTLIDGRIVQAGSGLTSKYVRKEIPTKMTGVLKPIFKFEDILFDGNYFTLKMTNYGNAEVNKIDIKVTVTIINAKELTEKQMLKEKETTSFDVCIQEIISRNGGKIQIPIISTASFPSFTISVKGEYFDVRNKKYNIPETSMSGQNAHFHKLPQA